MCTNLKKRSGGGSKLNLKKVCTDTFYVVTVQVTLLVVLNAHLLLPIFSLDAGRRCCGALSGASLGSAITTTKNCVFLLLNYASLNFRAGKIGLGKSKKNI